MEAAKQYTQQKRYRNNTDQLCAEAGVEYQPLVFETFGGLADEARDTLRSLNRVIASNTNTPKPEVANRFWQRISVDTKRQTTGHGLGGLALCKAGGV